MSDIVERLKENVNWLTRDGFETSAKNVQCALTEIESLRQQLAEKDAEIERLKTVPMKYRRMAFNAQLQDENNELEKQLAASQAENQQLRKWIDKAPHRIWCMKLDVYETDNTDCSCGKEALALPQDTTALEAMIAKTSEVMRERCESMLRYQGGANIDLVRALPGVTLEDLK